MNADEFAMRYDEVENCSDGSPLKLLNLMDGLLAQFGGMMANDAQERRALQSVADGLLKLRPDQDEGVEERLRELVSLLIAEEIAAREQPEEYSRWKSLRQENQSLAGKLARAEEQLRRAEQALREQEERHRLELAQITEERDRLKGELAVARMLSSKPEPTLRRPERSGTKQAASSDEGKRNVRGGLVVLAPNAKPGTIHAAAKGILVKGRTTVEQYLFDGMYQLETVEFTEDTRFLEACAFYNCSDVELVFHTRDCCIEEGAFHKTKVRQITAPTGGSVQRFAWEKDIPFVPLTAADGVEVPPL